MIKPLFTMFVVMGTSLLGMHNNMVLSNAGPSKMHEMQQRHPDMLPKGQKRILHILSPLYQRIFLYSLSEDEREMVAVFNRRGENPYRAIDNILKRDRKKNDSRYYDRGAPSSNQRRRKERYTISSQKDDDYDQKEQNTMDENEYAYEGESEDLYDENDRCIEEVPQGYKKMYKYSSKSDQRPSFASRCKGYFFKKSKDSCMIKQKTKRVKTSKKKKYEYIESMQRKRKCGCSS